jgi:3-deoxy-D-manno-octulosonic-acid transferase
VRNGAELGALMGEWLGDAHLRSRIGENGRQVVEANRGAAERLYRLLEAHLPGEETRPLRAVRS